MIEKLHDHIIKRLGDDVNDLDSVLKNFRHIKAKRNEQLLLQGNICNHVYFVASGCLQVYVYDKDDNETTRDIITEDNWCSELISFGSRQPSLENIRAIEPCNLFAIDCNSFLKMVKTSPQFDAVYKQILEASYANSVYRLNTFISLSALDRIKWLMDYRPKLMTRLPGKLLASYLGISKETFSRLKALL